MKLVVSASGGEMVTQYITFSDGIIPSAIANAGLFRFFRYTCELQSEAIRNGL